jgi:mono/diheme cytochrome c family protein
MRFLVTGLLLLAACGQDNPDQAQEVDAEPAALTFEGADYQTAAAKVAHGKRLAIILDCTGCHGPNLQGTNVTKDEPAQGDIYAPNITLLLNKYSDTDFEKLIRHGVPKDGREFWFMPVESYQFLSDPDLAAIIAYLRTFKPAGTQLPPIRKGPQFEKDVKQGLFGNAQAQIRNYRDNPPIEMGDQHAWGRYMVQTTCTACHNNALQGWEGFTPNLDIAGAYSKAELTRLLTTGEGKVKKDLGMMTGVARNSFSKLTPGEREAIVEYVLARAHRPQ